MADAHDPSGRGAVIGAAVPGVALAGTGAYRPDGGRIVPNADVDDLVTANGGRPMSAEWIERMGVRERWWTAVPGGGPIEGAPTTPDLLAGAIDVAVTDAGIGRGEVDLVIAATTTTSRLTTSMASVATGALGMTCAAFELRAGCASASAAMVAAYAHLAVGAECVVVAAAETLSGVAPGTGPLPYVAADGAAAVVLVRSADAERGLLGSWSGGDGSASTLAGAPGALPPRADELDAGRYRLVADQRFDEVARPWWSLGPSAVLRACDLVGSQVSAFVTNQAGRARMHESAGSAGIADEAVVDVIGETANAGCASQLIAFDHARRDGRAGDGSVVVLSAVGGGINAVTLALRP